MIAIIKYNAGNIRSVQNAVQRLGYSCIITDHKEEISRADKVIFPGVGEAGTAMSYLKQTRLDQCIVNLQQPVLGICLGLQLMCQFSEEGNTPCLGIFNTTVKKFPSGYIVPHMGWNTIEVLKPSMFNHIKPADDVYFVHSYYAGICEHTTAITNYIVPFTAAMQKNNFYATQFHTEKSAGVGDQILKSFLSL